MNVFLPTKCLQIAHMLIASVIALNLVELTLLLMINSMLINNYIIFHGIIMFPTLKQKNLQTQCWSDITLKCGRSSSKGAFTKIK